MLYGCKAFLHLENKAFPNTDADSDVITTEESPVDEVELQKELMQPYQKGYSSGGCK